MKKIIETIKSYDLDHIKSPEWVETKIEYKSKLEKLAILYWNLKTNKP